MRSGADTPKGATSSPRGRLRGSAVGLVTAGLVLSACSTGGAAAAEDAVSGFQQALISDPAKACDLLAPASLQELEKSSEMDCESALQDADLPDGGSPQHTDIAGHSARVVLDTDTVFLSLFDDGWKITAAGCEPPPDDSLPYDCTVKGA